MFVKLEESDPLPRVFAVGRAALNAATTGALGTTMRPSGLAITADGSLVIGDDRNQKVWMIRWAGARSPRNQSVLPWRHSGKAPEFARKMALVGKSSAK
jgi:hypothetical protein